MFNIIALAVAAFPATQQQHHHQQMEVTHVKFGKYEATLRIPEEGLYASEETDVEFRVVDTTQKDPIEDGFKGVGGISAKAKLTMPSMPGMPAAEPEVHREGIPGDYGIVMFFPHGGDYQVDLTLAIPGAGEHKIAFKFMVADERTGAPKEQPYHLQIVDWPATAQAGRPQTLNMQVVERKGNRVETAFDTAHEKDFHLLIASKDLNWFVHEHPVMKPDGTWTIDLTFPAGGDYWIYGDVAPKGKGSRVLISQVKVQGPKPTWNIKLTPSKTASDDGLKGLFASVGDIEIGRNATLQVKLFDEKTGMPAGDTVPWLGAAGHLMIFHQDGRTVVHSHPHEDEENAALVRKGIVRFSGRFPRPGLYKAYAQFDWRGKIRTLGFVIKVTENPS